MKRILLLLLFCCSSNFIFGQDFTLNINNKGNRLQTYPIVTEAQRSILDMVNQIDIPYMESKIRWMQDLGCRDAQSQEAIQTQNWLVDIFETFGLETYIHLFPCYDSYLGHCTQRLCNGDTLEAGNVVAIQYGTKYPDEVILVTAHYDQPDGPGADDNASGTVGLLQTARVLSQYEFDRTIMYVAFNAQEYRMVGSMPFAQKCAMEDMNIIGVFNYDMLGFFPEEIGSITLSSGCSPISERLWEYFYTVANIYDSNVPTFKFTKGDSDKGDHMPFNIYEYPALYIGDIEYKDLNPCYHKQCDTIGSGVNNLLLVRTFVRVTMAAVAELVNGFLPPQNFSAVPSEKNILLSWDDTNDISKYKLFRNDIKITETYDNFYIDNNVLSNTEYEYYVIGVKNDGSESPESNRDSAKINVPITIPYNNNFENENDLKDFNFYGQDWTITSINPHSGQACIVNSTVDYISDNYLTIAELQWFSIPDTVDGVDLEFYYRGSIQCAWANANFFVEVSTDRKKWDKLLKISGYQPGWELQTISLNNYIGEDFVQIRFRLESSGNNIPNYIKKVSLDNLSINFSSPGISVETYQTLKFEDVKIYPNPAEEEIIIKTGLETEYHITIYNVSGNKVREINNFYDGKLNLGGLNSGIYYVVISTDNNKIAKKIAVF